MAAPDTVTRMWLAVLALLAVAGGGAAGDGDAVTEGTGRLDGWPLPVPTAPPTDDHVHTVLTAVRDGCWCGPGAWAGGGGAVCRGAGLCRRVPTGALAALAAASPPPTQLLLAQTAVRALRPYDFASLSSLVALRVDNNPDLETVLPDAFRGLPGLRHLSLSSNHRLTRMVQGALRGLPALRTLRLESDGFRSAAAATLALDPASLPALHYLSLSGNIFKSLNAESLLAMNGSSLRELRLSDCRLERLSPDALRPLSGLRALHLGCNRLNASAVAAALRQMLRDEVPLRRLYLDDMGFRGSPPRDILRAAADLGVQHLVLARNHFPTLTAKAMQPMRDLQYLDLSECKMTEVEEGAFDEERLPGLRTLKLARNALVSLPANALPPLVANLDLSLNPWPRREGATFELDGQLGSLKNLGHLNLSFVNLNTLTPKAFEGLENLHDMLNLENASIVDIQPGAFGSLKNLTFLNLERNPFPQYSGITFATFEGLESLEVLLLGGCGITNFSDPEVFSALGSLRYLMLENNNISSVSPALLAPLPFLKGIDLSRNRLEPWVEEELFKSNPNISLVFLSGNKLTYLSPAMLEDFSGLTHLDIYDNPFNCDCGEFYNGKEWLSKNNITLDRIFSPGRAPLCYSPDNWRNKFITDFIQLSEYDGECPLIAPGGLDVYIIVGVFLGLLLVLGAVCGAMAYKYRAYIRYWMFLARRELRRRGHTLSRNRCKGPTYYKYDAFLSYSNEDRNYAVRLVSMLETYQPHLKLCVFERDFEIGSTISESVLKSIALSRHTVLIISDAFARSQWCMWELQMAAHHSLFFDDCADARRQGVTNPLVLVKLGEVTARHMTPLLKHVLRTSIYLNWNPEPGQQRKFWERLRSTLAPHVYPPEKSTSL